MTLGICSTLNSIFPKKKIVRLQDLENDMRVIKGVMLASFYMCSNKC
uniref:Uncharacterized protein n=1 Tax=Rhizophora mucronata TaxID=61149 RepID=A0A2P2Q1J9_RHIMU